MTISNKKSAGFSRQEIRSLAIYSVIVAAIAVGMFIVSPKGMGQVVGVIFTVILLPLPPLAIFMFRRRGLQKRNGANRSTDPAHTS